MEGQFLVRQIYDDEITYNLIGAAVEILSTLMIVFISNFKEILSVDKKQNLKIGGGDTERACFSNIITKPADIPADSILELFGKTFFEFCQDSGYDKILQVLGATPRDFLQVRPR